MSAETTTSSLLPLFAQVIKDFPFASVHHEKKNILV